MSVKTVLEDVGGDLTKAANFVASEWKKVKAGWKLISDPQTKALILTITQATIQTVKDSELALASGGFNIALDSTVYNDIKTLIADAEAGEPVILSDLKAIGIIFSSPNTVTVTAASTPAAAATPVTIAQL